MRLFMGKLRSRSERQFNYTYKEHIGGINKNQCPRPKDHQRSMAGSVLQWNLVWILQEGDIYLTLPVTNVPAPAHSIPSLGCGYDQTYIWWLVYFVRTQVGKTPRIWSRHVNTYNCGLHSPATHKRINVPHSTNFYSHWISAELNNKAPKSSKNLEL